MTEKKIRHISVGHHLDTDMENIVKPTHQYFAAECVIVCVTSAVLTYQLDAVKHLKYESKS